MPQGLQMHKVKQHQPIVESTSDLKSIEGKLVDTSKVDQVGGETERDVEYKTKNSVGVGLNDVAEADTSTPTPSEDTSNPPVDVPMDVQIDNSKTVRDGFKFKFKNTSLYNDSCRTYFMWKNYMD